MALVGEGGFADFVVSPMVGTVGIGAGTTPARFVTGDGLGFEADWGRSLPVDNCPRLQAANKTPIINKRSHSDAFRRRHVFVLLSRLLVSVQSPKRRV